MKSALTTCCQDGITGETVASYTYDAFGRTIAQSGPMATFFRHRFSTKYYDEETDIYYYGYRFYSTEMGRWLNRDPIEEEGGDNLYIFCCNGVPYSIDIDGRISVTDYIMKNIGYDRSGYLLGRYGIPIGAPGARFQIHGYLSGELFTCCRKNAKKVFAKITLGLEPYIVWGKGKKWEVKGRDRNKKDEFRPEKKKKYKTLPQDSGYRSRLGHLGKISTIDPCPKDGLEFSSIRGSIFLRASAGMGYGVQMSISKRILPQTNICEGWTISGELARSVWGTTIEVGGNVFASVTYGPF